MAEPTAPKPCPFCGGTDLELRGKRHLWIGCKTCGAEGPHPTTDPDHARELWNRRADRAE